MGLSRWILFGWAAMFGAAIGGAACDSEDTTDGATTTSATTSGATGGGGSGGSFTCDDAGADANDTPPTVKILKPTEGAVYKTTDIIPLEGSVTDAVDGMITSQLQVLWFKDNVDPTGEGPVDSVDPAEDGAFMPGMHTITLKGTNSRCLEGSQTVNIVVQ